MIIMPTTDISILKQLPKLVSSYRVPSFSQAALQFIYSFVPFVGIRTAMYFLMDVSYLLVLLLAIVNGFFLLRLFVIQHDCGHQSFTKSRKVNNIIGFVCSMLTLVSYTYRAKSHSFHHDHNQKMREHRDIGDINTYTVEEYSKLSRRARLKYRIFRSAPVLFGIGPSRYFIIKNRLPMDKVIYKTKEFLALIRNNLALIAVYTIIGFIFGRKSLVLMQLPIVIWFSTISMRLFYIQHQHEFGYKAWHDKREYVRAAVEWSSFYDLPRFFHWLTGNIGYHHIHHLNASVPSYQLARCFREQPLLQQVAKRVTFRESLSCLRNHLRDEQQQKMISFRAYYRLYGRRQQVA